MPLDVLFMLRIRFPRPFLVSTTIVVSSFVGLSACSSDSAAPTTAVGTVITTEPPKTTEPEPTTTEPATTELATISTDAPTTEAPTTTTSPAALAPATVYALTGLAITDPIAALRPALVVKIDNAPGARPQTGFNEADIVFEEIVNDNLTRFAMVFQSQGSDPVGPIRSGRIQDINLFGALNHPLFAWSGGNRTVTDAIHNSDLLDIGPSRASVYFRTGRSAPHNLYSKTQDLWAQAPPFWPSPAQQFTYRNPDDIAAGEPSAGVLATLDSIDVRWDWDASVGLYRRTMERRVHEDASSGQITTNNVVVLVMQYASGISGSPDAQTIGSGEAFVFAAGKYVHATWTRNDRLDPFTLTADDGSIVALTPGRTFIELPRPGHTLPLAGE